MPGYLKINKTQVAVSECSKCESEIVNKILLPSILCCPSTPFIQILGPSMKIVPKCVY